MKLIKLSQSEDLNSMILPVADDDVAVGEDGDAFQSFELAVAGSPSAEGSDERSIGTEDLDAIVTRIGNDDVALVVHGHTAEKNSNILVDSATARVGLMDSYRGNLKWPSSVPSWPNEVKTLPLTSKT